MAAVSFFVAQPAEQTKKIKRTAGTAPEKAFSKLRSFRYFYYQI